eukprot:XP_025013486.1 uncharacterized protein LOC112535177 [Ricinus communis]
MSAFIAYKCPLRVHLLMDVEGKPYAFIAKTQRLETQKRPGIAEDSVGVTWLQLSLKCLGKKVDFFGDKLCSQGLDSMFELKVGLDVVCFLRFKSGLLGFMDLKPLCKTFSVRSCLGL